MSTPDAFANLQAEYASTDMSRLHRSLAFGAIADSMQNIFRGRQTSALYMSAFMDGGKRDILLIRHQPKGRFPAAARLLLNHTGLSVEDPTRHVISGEELVSIPTRGLIRMRKYSMLEPTHPDEPVSSDCFIVHHPDNASMVLVRHGLGYRPDFPTDVPSVTPAGLQQRQELAHTMTHLLSQFLYQDSTPVDYLFIPQLGSR